MPLKKRDRPGLCSSLRNSLAAASLLFITQVAAEDLPVIEVTGLLPDDLSMTPGAAAVVDAADIERLRPYTLHDLFDSVAGLRTIDDDVTGRRAAIAVRGAPPRRSRKTLLLEDGVPLNLSSYIDPSAHYTPPMERLERVEVIKAAGQLRHGPLNNHGIVNFRNRQAGERPESRLSLAGGSLDSFRRHLSHSRREGDVGMLFAYSGFNADGRFDVEDMQYDDFHGSVDWQVNAEHGLEMSATWHRERSHYDESNLTPQEYAVAPDRKAGRFGQEYNRFALDYRKLALRHDWDAGGRLRVSSLAFVTDADRPRFTANPGDVAVAALPELQWAPGDGAFIPGEQGRMVSRDRRYRTRGLDSRMTLAAIDTGQLRHELEWGLRYEQHYLNDMRSTGEVGEILSVNQRGPLGRDVAHKARAVSLYAQDRITHGDWQVTPGLRTEYYEQSKQRKSIRLDPGPHGPEESDYNRILLPGVSVLFRGWEDSQLFANLARGYTPAPSRTAEAFPLEPETGINAQLGARYQPHAAFEMEAALFFNRIRDTIVQLPYSMDGMSLVLNSADSRSFGGDLSLEARRALVRFTGFESFAQLALNYTRAEFTENRADAPIRGNRVPEVSNVAGSLTLGVSHTAGWTFSASWSHRSSFYTDPMNTRDLVLTDGDREPLGEGDWLSLREPVVLGRVAGRGLLGARLVYDMPTDNISLWLQGRNLLDRRYVADLENGMRPGAERTLMAGVELRF